MSTIRLQIVEAMAALLATATGLPVLRNLDYALESQNLPALVVRSGPDDHRQLPGGEAANEVTVSIHILVKAEDPEAAADAIEQQVHTALLADTRLGGLANNVVRQAGDWNFDLGDLAERSVTYRADFFTSAFNLSIQ